MLNLDAEIHYHFTRSQGAGGQNVNKVNTSVELIFNIIDSEILNEYQKQRIIQELGSRINKNGEIRLRSQRARSQLMNRLLVTGRFYKLLDQALKEKTVRIATEPTKASTEKRMKKKKMVSERKQSRRKPEI